MQQPNLTELPPINPILVEALRERFPVLVPASGRSIREYDEAAGIEKVFAFLESALKAQKNRR